jgi:RNA polymerase sigma-70 factor (ECF subfamily)
MKELSDEELIQSYRRSRDKSYVGELFERYTHLVLGVCINYLKDRDESKDAVMEIFAGLFDKLLEFNIESFKSWIYKVAQNHCLMKLRKEKTARRHHLEIKASVREDFMESPGFNHPLELEGDSDEEKISLLGKAIGQLRTEQKTCIELMYLEQKSYREVSEITGYDMKKVKSYIQNGKRNLKIILEKK